MTPDSSAFKRQRRKPSAQFGIGTCLAAMTAIACFFATANLLLAIGIPAFLVVPIVVPAAIGTFSGTLYGRVTNRNTIVCSLTGCSLGLSPIIALYLLAALLRGFFGTRRHWLAQPSSWYLSDSFLTIFMLTLCLLLSILVGVLLRPTPRTT